jgi:NAD(P)-dependent dehydrogenase (short-subunit alcohol dehydrogenase family)
MENKHVIITGGGQGIGKYSAMIYLQNGYDVTIAESDTEAGAETLNELSSSGRIQFVRCDVSKEEDVISTVKKAITFSGRIDVVVNNAAIAANKPIVELSAEEFSKVLAVNVTGGFLFAKHAHPFLKKSNGTIINISSTRAFMSEPNTEAYSASKGAVYSLTHALAVSLGPEVRVNCISPGWIDVSGLKKNIIRKEEVLTEADHLQHPAGRVGNANDIARLLLFLSDKENNFITGQNFIVDGGITRKMIYV